MLFSTISGALALGLWMGKRMESLDIYICNFLFDRFWMIWSKSHFSHTNTRKKENNLGSVVRWLSFSFSRHMCEWLDFPLIIFFVVYDDRVHRSSPRRDVLRCRQQASTKKMSHTTPEPKKEISLIIKLINKKNCSVFRSTHTKCKDNEKLREKNLSKWQWFSVCIVLWETIFTWLPKHAQNRIYTHTKQKQHSIILLCVRSERERERKKTVYNYYHRRALHTNTGNELKRRRRRCLTNFAIYLIYFRCAHHLPELQIYKFATHTKYFCVIYQIVTPAVFFLSRFCLSQCTFSRKRKKKKIYEKLEKPKKVALLLLLCCCWLCCWCCDAFFKLLFVRSPVSFFVICFFCFIFTRFESASKEE